MAVPSSEAEQIISGPRRFTSTELTMSVCDRKFLMHAPVSISHTRTVLSVLAEMRCLEASVLSGFSGLI
uniref:Uncharacterized protein n=1 Tax=Caenorhabditis japonica TaxID=281687 RepID=A0A8R1EIN0_CAEJA